MIKKTAWVLFFFAWSISVWSQTPSKSRIGIETGPSLILLYGNTFLEKAHLPFIGFNAGVSFQYEVYDQPEHFFKSNGREILTTLTINTSVYFERKGCIATPKSLSDAGVPLGNTTVYTNFEYITIPILFKAAFRRRMSGSILRLMRRNKLGKSNERAVARPRYYIQVGPYFGALLNQNFIYDDPDSLKLTSDNTINDKRFDLGITLGLGMELPLSRQFTLTFEIRNNLGLYNISAVPVSGNGTIQTNSTNGMIGMLYRFNRKEKVE